MIESDPTIKGSLVPVGSLEGWDLDIIWGIFFFFGSYFFSPSTSTPMGFCSHDFLTLYSGGLVSCCLLHDLTFSL